MICNIVTKEFKIVGQKNKGLFVDYGKLVPQAAQRFLQQANNISNSTGYEVTVYEPRKDDTHLEGIFYVGIIVEEQPDSLLDGLEFLEIQHTYAVIKGKVTEIASLYSRIDRWITDQSFRRETPEQYILEIYYAVLNGVEEVEIYIPVI